jgi:hypothetical protein
MGFKSKKNKYRKSLILKNVLQKFKISLKKTLSSKFKILK